MTEFADRFWTSRDGLKLHYRDYPGGGEAHDSARAPIICLHGLTRNARDFETLARRLSQDGRRVLCPEMRGRGDSEYARDPASYNPLQYVEDLTALLDHEEIGRFVSIGTSLGGLMTMLLALTEPERIAAAVMNDVGPVLEVRGLTRIKEYVGKGSNYPTWLHAARGLAEVQGVAYPGYDIDQWLEMAKRLMVLAPNGRIVLDYDMKIAEPFAAMDVNAQADLWPALAALAGKPVLVVRGALSDLLSEATLAGMVERLPGAEAVTIDGVGHAPTLNEPQVAAAIDRLLARVG
ncbi:MAG TPA: alpha/beta hydrolase [Novosphingobium sp.]|nr:alpha/beta hydrolase [Novosphingobium sp.]